ncbi:MAG: hypothetical protein Q9P14_13390 [candidate division KSB1 bacterium]|nr:hypothetical protein [candidate division KSB1 bacterium]
MLQLDKLGLDMALFALRREPPGPVPNEAVQLLEKTAYLQRMPLPRKLAYHVAVFVRHPFGMYWPF